MWIHDFKNLMAHKKLWYAMTNISAINSRHTKIYGVIKNHGLPWKFVTPCCQMACYVIIKWKTKLLLIAIDNNFQLDNEWNYLHESWCEISVTSREVLRL
jgi:hypothetical protein